MFLLILHLSVCYIPILRRLVSWLSRSWIEWIIVTATWSIQSSIRLPCDIWMAILDTFILLVKHATLFLNLLFLNLLKRQVFITVDNHIASTRVVIDVVSTLWILLGVVATYHTYSFSFFINIFLWSHSIDHGVSTNDLLICSTMPGILIRIAVRWIIAFHIISWILCWCDISTWIFLCWNIIIHLARIFYFMMISCGISFLNPWCFRWFVMLGLYSVDIFVMLSEGISAVLEVVVFQGWIWTILLLRILVSNWTRLFLFSTILNLRHRFRLLEHFLVHLIII